MSLGRVRAPLVECPTIIRRRGNGTRAVPSPARGWRPDSGELRGVRRRGRVVAAALSRVRRVAAVAVVPAAVVVAVVAVLRQDHHDPGAGLARPRLALPEVVFSWITRRHLPLPLALIRHIARQAPGLLRCDPRSRTKRPCEQPREQLSPREHLRDSPSQDQWLGVAIRTAYGEVRACTSCGLGRGLGSGCQSPKLHNESSGEPCARSLLGVPGAPSPPPLGGRARISAAPRKNHRHRAVLSVVGKSCIR